MATMMRVGCGVSTLLALALIAGCVADSSPSDPASPVGQWGSDEPSEPGIAFASDGTYTGSDSCNGHGGSWRDDGGTIYLDGYMTAMMCLDGGDQWIAGTRTFIVRGDVLHGFDDNGDPTGTLRRSGD